MKIKIEDVIYKCVDSRNEKLFHEINEKTSIQFVEYHKWGVNIISEKIIYLYYNLNSYNPSASFTHELLHIKYYYLGLICPTHTERESFDSFITAIFNQLCHHKFFNEFCSLGYDVSDFLDRTLESETFKQYEQTIKKLEYEFSKNKKLEDLFDLFSLYLMLKSPHDQSEITENYINRLKNLIDEPFFRDINKAIYDWINESNYNASLTFAKLLKCCKHLDIGFYINNPNEVIYSRNL